MSDTLTTILIVIGVIYAVLSIPAALVIIAAAMSNRRVRRV